MFLGLREDHVRFNKTLQADSWTDAEAFGKLSAKSVASICASRVDIGNFGEAPYSVPAGDCLAVPILELQV